MKVRLCVLFLVLAAVPVDAADFFVTQTGGGTRDGTAGNPWSVADYNSSTTPAAGDAVRFTGNFTSTVRPATSGSALARLTLDFTLAKLDLADTRLAINGKNYITAIGGELGPASGTQMLINSEDVAAHDITIRGWRYVGPEGGVAQLVGGAQWSNLVVENNYADNVLRLILGQRATRNVVIRNNWARTGVQRSDQADLIFWPDSEEVLIEGNKLIQRSIGDYGTNHADVIQTFRSGAGGNIAPKNYTIRYNWLEQSQLQGDGSLSWLTLQDMEGFLKIYGNVFYGKNANSTRGIDVVFGAASLIVYYYNNTVIADNGPGAVQRFHAGGGVLHARNNVGMTPSVFWGWFTWALPAGSPWNNNFFLNAEDCQPVYVGPQGSCTANPGFVDFANANFALSPTSPLIGKGDSSIGAEYSAGIAPGATWPNPKLLTRSGAWDVGAYVFNGTTPEPAPTPVPPPPAPVDPCVADPLRITALKWPTSQTGNRSFSWNSGSKTIVSVRLAWPFEATFKDNRGCSVTVKR